MTAHRISLDVIDVKEPCPVSWDSMRGDERVRFCDECSLHVYNLSAMTRPQAEALVNQWEPGGRMCVKFYRRADGTVLTKDCEGGIRAAARRARRWAGAVASAALCAVLSPIGLRAFVERENKGVTVNPPEQTHLQPPGQMIVGAMPMPVMDDVVCPPATQPAPPQEFLGRRVMPLMGKVKAPSTQPATQPSSE